MRAPPRFLQTAWACTSSWDGSPLPPRPDRPSGVILVVVPGLVAIVALATSTLMVAPPPPRVPIEGLRQQRDSPGALGLTRTADGGFMSRDVDAGLEATIHPDGSVTFRNVVRTAPYLETPFGSFGRKPPKDDDVPQSDVAEVENMETMPPQPYGPAPILIGVGGRLPGIGDLRRDSRSKAKREFLASTRELRERLARAAARKRLTTALVHLRGELLQIWRDESRTMAQRRRLLFERWDECVEEPEEDPAAPVALGAAGTVLLRDGAPESPRPSVAREARRRIEAFVREMAPEGTPNAYTRHELRRLNAARVSAARFDPYRDVSPLTAK